MLTRQAEAMWEGSVRRGDGLMDTESGAFKGAYSFVARFQEEDPSHTNPEELIAAAHAGCFSMTLADVLSRAGYEDNKIYTRASVILNEEADGHRIERIELDTDVHAPLIPDEDFLEYAESAKERCLVSQALASVPINVEVEQVNEWDH